jgi:broad specificity phosphatase PhoE
MSRDINFIFLRHGESCQNLLYKIYSKGNLTSRQYHKLFTKFIDPTLSDTGVQDSKTAGIILKKNLHKIGINKIHFIASSPMIRAIETAYYMSLLPKQISEITTDKTIYVCPYLREMYTGDSAFITDQKFPLKSISEQKKYLSENELNAIDFKFVQDEHLRREPGHLKKFIKWFGKSGIAQELINKNKESTLNVIIFLHSHVIKEFSDLSSKNNTGFILKTVYNKNNFFYTKNDIYKHTDHFDRSKFECPSTKCPGICQ